MMILVAKTPVKEGVAKIAARFARHFYPSTPLFLKSWIRPCIWYVCFKISDNNNSIDKLKEYGNWCR